MRVALGPIIFMVFLQACTNMDSTSFATPSANINDTAPSEGPRWTSLFAGQDLNSFIFIGDDQWTIADAHVEASSGQPKFLVTKSIFRDIEIYAEFWASPEANSGIFIRCQDITSIAAATCYEVNIYDQRPDQKYRTGGVVNFAEPLVFRNAANKWNTLRIISEAEHILVYLNDELTADMEDDTFFSGPIAFQWTAGTVRFRNLRFRPL
jgi:hypothetical protein